MDTGSANLISPQWIPYSSSDGYQTKWFVNGADHVTAGNYVDLAAVPQSPASSFYARGTVSPLHSRLPPQPVVSDVMYRQAGPMAAHVDVLPKFPPPMFDIPDIQDSNSVFECDARQTRLMSNQIQRQSNGWPGEQSQFWTPMTSVTEAVSAGSSLSNSSPSGNYSDETVRCDVGVPVGHLASVSTTRVASENADGCPTVSTSSSNCSSSSTKRAKSLKKRKRRDPNEPQKPVSAYSLFFRNAQAAIKNRNPSATFGDVSKIVASMWDNLDENVKNYYKRQMEAAKKDYLKQLAVYRAGLASNTASSSSNNSSSSKISSDDSVETVGSRKDTETDQQSHYSPTPSSASLLRVDGDLTGKITSSPVDIAAAANQYSPVGLDTGPAASSMQGAVPPPGHLISSNTAMGAAAATSNYFSRYASQRYEAADNNNIIAQSQYMSSSAAVGGLDNGSNYYMRSSYQPVTYNSNMVVPNRQHMGPQIDFQLQMGAP